MAKTILNFETNAAIYLIFIPWQNGEKKQIGINDSELNKKECLKWIGVRSELLPIII